MAISVNMKVVDYLNGQGVVSNADRLGPPVPNVNDARAVPFGALLHAAETTDEAVSPASPGASSGRKARQDEFGVADDPESSKQPAVALPPHDGCRAGFRVGPATAIGGPPTSAVPDARMMTQDVLAAMLRAVSIHQIAETTALKLQVSTASLPRVDLDLRVVAGRLKVTLGVEEQTHYQLLHGAAADLDAVLRARGMAADPVTVVLQAPGDETAQQGAHDHRSSRDASEFCTLDVEAPRNSRVHRPALPAGRRSSTSYIA